MLGLLACFAATIATAAVSPARAQSIPAIHFDPAEGNCVEDGCSFGERGWGSWGFYFEERTMGWSFTLTETATVTHLAVLDENGDGLRSSFQVGLWEAWPPTESPLASAIIPAGELAPLHGLWRLVPVEPLTLDANVHYLIGAAPSAPSFDRNFFLNFDPVEPNNPVHDPSAVPFDPRVDVAFSSPSLSSESGFHRPNEFVLVTGANLGPNVFFAEPIPEPHSGWLVAIGAIGCIMLRTSQWIARRGEALDVDQAIDEHFLSASRRAARTSELTGQVRHTRPECD